VKKLVNDPRNVVVEMLEGLVDVSDHLALLDGENVVVQAPVPGPEKRPVAILSGGGSGHEPAHAGYVGRGMLTAAVAGDVFTSPSVDAILAAILAVAGPKGAVLIVKNYTGDRLNFALAAELAHERGIPAEVVVVADDVSLNDIVPVERRRGIAGTVLVHKIAGAAAERGLDIQEVAAVARRAASQLATMGVGLSACTVPAAGRPGFELPADEIEFGLGIHGEKGVSRSSMKPADEIVDGIIDVIRTDLLRRNMFTPGNQAVLLVNGMGATPPMELLIVARRALSRLRELGLRVVRAWAGDYMTALDMAGCSITVLPVDDSMLALLDAPTQARSWPGSGVISDRRLYIDAPKAQVAEQPVPAAGPIAQQLARALREIAHTLKEAEPLLTELDSKAGDGDLGASMFRGAEALQSLPAGSDHTAQTLLLSASHALRRAVAGSSGPFYAVGLARAARTLADVSAPSAEQWHAAFLAAIDAISETGGARPGDRTMLDALVPASQAWQMALAQGKDARAAYDEAVLAAESGARATEQMTPRLGRASYLGDRAKGAPDGGAVAVALWMRAIAKALD